MRLRVLLIGKTYISEKRINIKIARTAMAKCEKEKEPNKKHQIKYREREKKKYAQNLFFLVM